MPDNETVLAAWQRLKHALTEAAKHYQMQDDGGRAAAFRQIGAIIEFIRTVDPDRPLDRIPLSVLHLALGFLDHGIQMPMLKPMRGRGRRPDELMIKARSAVTMTRLMKPLGKLRRSDAGKKVAAVLRNLGYDATQGAVEDWRDKAISAPADDLLGQSYRAMLNETALDTETGTEAQLLALRKWVVLCRPTSASNLAKMMQKK